MQISGANLLLAAQGAKPVAAPALPKAAAFTPRALTVSEPAKSEPLSQPSGPVRLGQHVDVKV